MPIIVLFGDKEGILAMLSFVVARDEDMYDIMEIRNSGRQFMTHHTEEITPEQQYDWWMAKDTNHYRIWLVVNELNYIVGFVMLRVMDNGHVWGTLAVYPEYQGRGYGTVMYGFMQLQDDEIWIEIRNDNLASLRAAEKAGFSYYYRNDEITTMVYRR